MRACVSEDSELTAAIFVREVASVLTIVVAVTDEVGVNAALLARDTGVRPGPGTAESSAQNTHRYTCNTTLHQYRLYTSTDKVGLT